MKCPDSGTIQAYIDGELDIKNKKEVENHIINCNDCTHLYKSLKSNDDFVFEKMTSYKNYNEDNSSRPVKVFHPRTETPVKTEKRKGVSYYMLKYNKFIAAACAVLIVSTLITVQPARALISDVLSIFRVENIKGFRITPQELAQIEKSLSTGQGDFNIDKIGKIKVDGGKNRPASYDEINKVCGFPILLPADFSDIKPDITFVEPMTLGFTLNVENTNQVLKSLKAKDLFPEEVDGKTFTARFGPQASIKYSIGTKEYTLIQTTSPKLEVPEGVDADKLFSTVVNIPIFPEELKSRLKSITDWKSTLYIPLTEPVEEIRINDITAFVSSTSERTNNTMQDKTISRIIWMDNGVIYGIISNTDKDDLISFAKNLK
jgi:hypothetical protein